MIKVLEHFQYIKFDRSHAWHRTLVCMYCSIVEYSDTLLVLRKEEKFVSIPLVVRALLEGFVDLKNLCGSPEYGNNIQANYLDEWLRITKEAGKLENPYLNLHIQRFLFSFCQHHLDSC